MALSMFLLEVLKRPSIDPELLESYEKLMHLLENDPTLEYMCEELPEWFTHRLSQGVAGSEI